MICNRTKLISLLTHFLQNHTFKDSDFVMLPQTWLIPLFCLMAAWLLALNNRLFVVILRFVLRIQLDRTTLRLDKFIKND